MKKYILPYFGALLTTLSAFSQQGQYEVYALRFASVAHPLPISVWVDKGPEKDSVNIHFMFWLIKGTNGKKILVDAGFLNGLEEAKEFDLTSYIRPDSVLLEVSVTPEDITDIIISHPHWDHIDGVDLFPNAQVWMQKEDYTYFVGAAWQKPGFNGGFDKRDVRKMVELNLAGRLTLVDGDDKEIIPGIKVYTGSRHTFNSQFVRVQTGSNSIILASDNIWIYYNLEHLAPASTGGTFDKAGYVKAMQRMKTLVADTRYIVPGHDAQLFSKFPMISKDIVKIR